jgi:hypothetical protein
MAGDYGNLSGTLVLIIVAESTKKKLSGYWNGGVYLNGEKCLCGTGSVSSVSIKLTLVISWLDLQQSFAERCLLFNTLQL